MLYSAPITRSGVPIFVVLASLLMIVAPSESPLADTKPSPVTVVNPSTSPVPTTVDNPAASPALISRVDDPGRNAYQGVPESIDCSNPGACFYFFADVPQGHRLVIQHISANQQVAIIPSNGSITLELFSVPVRGGTGISLLSAPLTTSVVTFNQPVLFYIEGGDAPKAGFVVSGAGFAGSGDVTLTGYLLDCTSIPCAAIVN